MNYYIQGNKKRADEIRAAFEKLGIDTTAINVGDEDFLYFSSNGLLHFEEFSNTLLNIFKTHPDYQELELPVQPKFKAEDRIVSKSEKSTIYRIITLCEERMEYIVAIEHKDYHESCPWIAFEDQDDYELAPKPHYDIKNFHAGMPVLVRDNKGEEWRHTEFSHISSRFYENKFAAGCTYWCQCIPFDGNERLLGTTDMPSEEYINW